MKRLIVTPLVFILLFAGCDKEDAWDFLKTRGGHVVEERAVTAFHAITVKNGINVVLTQGDNYTATIEGWKNLTPKIRLTVEKNGELVIEDVNRFNFVRTRDNMTTVRLMITGELDRIHFSGDGDIVTKDTLVTSGLTVLCEDASGSVDLKIKTQGIYIGTNHRNTASVTIWGQGYSVGITNWGYAPVDLSGFKASFADVHHHGPGNVYVNASESVSAVIYGTGDVYYAGNPSSVTFTRKDKGKGNLYQTED